MNGNQTEKEKEKGKEKENEKEFRQTHILKVVCYNLK